MFNPDRLWSVHDIATPEELGRELRRVHWTLCTAFRCNGIIWANDSTSEDGIQEFAVIREATGLQIESVTIGWCSPERLAEYQRIYADGFDCMAEPFDVTRLQEEGDHGSCWNCA